MLFRNFRRAQQSRNRRETGSKKGCNTEFAETKANFLASTQDEWQGGRQLLGLLVLDIYLGLFRMITSISVPATGFFTCKASLFLFLGNNWISSQAVNPDWLGLAGHEWSEKGNTQLLAHARTQCQDYACSGATGTHLCVWCCIPVYQFIMWGQARGVSCLWAFMFTSTCWAAALLSLCLITSSIVTSGLCNLLHLCSPDNFALGQIQPKAVQPREEHWVLLPEALWLFGHCCWWGLQGIWELWWIMEGCWGLKEMKDGRGLGEGWWKCLKF